LSLEGEAVKRVLWVIVLAGWALAGPAPGWLLAAGPSPTAPKVASRANRLIQADRPEPLPMPSEDNGEKKAEDKPSPPGLDGGDTAWMLMSTGLVLFMVPGLALFYGGMVRRKNVLGTMMHSMIALGLVGVQWLLLGYSLAFGESQGGLIGWNSNYLGLWGVDPSAPFPGTKIPIYVHCMYQGMFAIITPALISGALAERVRFGPYCLFLLLWAILVYDPLAHWVWAVTPKTWVPTPQADAAGWLGKLGALDFAGGTVVHISAGFSALAAILLLPRRRGYPEHAMHPNSMVLTLTGAGILWFGWFGFNGGSALGSSGLSGMALANSQAAAAGAALAWVAVEWLHRGKPTALGLASGLVAGLVAVTPASGFVHPLSALGIGVLAGCVCYLAVALKPRAKYDDSLDAFGIHGVGGFLGALLTGVFASAFLWNNAQGNSPPWDLGELFKDQAYVAGGRTAQVLVQLVAALAAAIYGFVVSGILVKVIDLAIGFNADAREEGAGLDVSQHGEVGFDLGPSLEQVPEAAPAEPRPADVPPRLGGRFTVVVEGAPPAELMHAWSSLCQTGNGPPPADFRAVYPFVTTVKGNRFRFRGGDRNEMRAHVQRLFQDRLGAAVQTHIEE
jgi:ammonium transporter